MVANPALLSRHPTEGGVMEDDRLAVCREVDVKFHAVARLAGSMEGGEGILRRALRAPEAAMGDGGTEEEVPGLSELRLHLTSTTASTSTAKFSGRR